MDFSTVDYVLCVLVGLIIGLSKTALPGAGLIATPMVAMVFSGREIPGATLPILLLADLFAVRWYREDARVDLLKPLIPWVALGFAGGAAFFMAIGNATRTFEIAIATLILVLVTVQIVRLIRKRPPAPATTAAAIFFGSLGGFATFVSNQAGPILNTHLTRLLASTSANSSVLRRGSTSPST